MRFTVLKNDDVPVEGKGGSVGGRRCAEKPCRQFLDGHCQYGDTCWFRHGTAMDVVDKRGQGEGRKAVKVCPQFQAGSCRYGDSCWFLHPSAPPASVNKCFPIWTTAQVDGAWHPIWRAMGEGHSSWRASTEYTKTHAEAHIRTNTQHFGSNPVY